MSNSNCHVTTFRGINVMRIRTTLAIFMAIAAGACDSALDIDTPRIVTRLTNSVKLRGIIVNAALGQPTDTTAVTIDNWSYTIRRSDFSIDTGVTPPRISMNCRLVPYDAGIATPTGLVEVWFRLDDVSADTPSMQLGTDPAAGTGASAQYDFNGVRRTRVVNASLHTSYFPGASPVVSGNLSIGMADGSDSANIFVNFTATRD